MKKAFYTLMAVFALFMASAVRADEEKVDIKAEFEYEQKVCMEAFVKAWQDEKSEKELNLLLANMVRANSRYRMTAGIDNSLVASMLRATEAGRTVKEKMCLAICEYYRVAKGINLDVRANFNRGSFKVRN